MTSTFARSRSSPLSYSRVGCRSGILPRWNRNGMPLPQLAESRLDVYKSIQQSVETTHDREITDVFSDLLERLQLFET